MARGRLAKIGMLRRLIRVKSTLPRHPSPPPRCAVSHCAVSRRAAPPAAPRRSSRYRGAFTRPARWHGAFTRPARWHGVPARSRPAQRAGTPQQWSQCAGTPQQWSQRAITPHPRPLHVEIRVALHPAESVATLRHRYRHSIRLGVQFVATDCMANRRRSVSSRLGHLYVSKERQGPGRPNLRRPHGTRARALSHLGRLRVSCATCQCSDVGRPPTREGAVLPRRPRAPSTRQASAQKRPAPRGCGPTKAGCESISRRWK